MIVQTPSGRLTPTWNYPGGVSFCLVPNYALRVFPLCVGLRTVPRGSGFCPTKVTGEYTLQVTAGRFGLLWVTLQGFDSPRLHLFCLGTAGDFLRLFPKMAEVFPSPAQGWEFCLPHGLLWRVFWGNIVNMSHTAPSVKIIHGDCIDVMRDLPENSVDSIVTDPPYGLGFMGKKWDDLPPGKDWAEECLRVLKPGGHMLAFGGTRTWHRLAVSIEDAGFEIRDSIAWLYGSGFPKHRAALKPAFEPVVMARKPFKGSLTANEAVYGTGALNINASRIGTSDTPTGSGGRRNKKLDGDARTDSGAGMFSSADGVGYTANPSGRFPANVILDVSQTVELDAQSGVSKSPTPYVQKTLAKGDVYALGSLNNKAGKISTHHGDKGGASRFFYVAKASKKERPVVDGVAHPTVKPLSLMQYLVKLVTPPSGTVLEPFAGSGATVEACLLEGFDVIAVEREAGYLPLIEARIERNKAA